MIAVTVTWLVHVAATSGRSLWELSHRARRGAFGRASLITSHSVILAGCLVAAFLGLIVGETTTLPQHLPDLNALWSELLGAAVGGLIAAYLITVSTNTVGSTRDSMLRHSRTTIPDGTWQFARRECTARDIEFRLFAALMLTENLQRPFWIRRLERLKGLFVKSGTYGVMQVSSERPLTDEESITRAAERLASRHIRLVDGYPDYGNLRQVLRGYNPGPIFIAMASEAYFS